MSDFQMLANTLLAHAPALTLAIGTGIAIGLIIVIVILLWPRKPPQDPIAEQRMADLNARVLAMGDLLARAQSQLQQTVHERLDAVTARLGDSMRTSTKDTTAKDSTMTSTPMPGLTAIVGAVSAPPRPASPAPTVNVSRYTRLTLIPIAALISRSWITASRSLP